MGAKDGRCVTVPSRLLSHSLHELNITAIDFLKLDVEGAEYDILLGDDELWSSISIRTLAVEMDRQPRDARYKFGDLCNLLRSRFRSVTETGSNYPLVVCSMDN